MDTNPTHKSHETEPDTTTEALLRGPPRPRSWVARITVLTALLALTAILSGCLSPADKGKGQVVDDADFLKNKHLQVHCSFSMDGNEGVHAQLKECDNGRLNAGSITEAKFEWQGLDATGSFSRNREASVTGTAYFPSPHGNSAPDAQRYRTESGATSTFSVTIDIPVDKFGLGSYQICFNIEQYKNVSWWSAMGAYDAQALPASIACKDFKIKTGGWF